MFCGVKQFQGYDFVPSDLDSLVLARFGKKELVASLSPCWLCAVGMRRNRGIVGHRSGATMRKPIYSVIDGREEVKQLPRIDP